MKFIKWVEEGEMAPRGYGVAWRDYQRPRIYCAPIPLHWVVGYARRWWFAMRYPRWPATLHEKCDIAEAKAERRLVKIREQRQRLDASLLARDVMRVDIVFQKKKVERLEVLNAELGDQNAYLVSEAFPPDMQAGVDG